MKSNATVSNNRFVEFLMDAYAYAAMMTLDDAVKAIRLGCESHHNWGLIGPNWLHNDQNGWYKASLNINIPAESISVIITAHEAYEYQALKGIAEYNPDKLVFPEEGEEKFFGLVAGILRLSPEKKTVKIQTA